MTPLATTSRRRAAAFALAFAALGPFAAGAARAESPSRYVGKGGSLGDLGFRRDGIRLPGGIVIGAGAGWVAPVGVGIGEPSLERSLGWSGAWIAYELVHSDTIDVSVDTVLAHGGSCTYDSEEFDGCRRLETFLIAEPTASVRIALHEDVSLGVTGGWRFVTDSPSMMNAPAHAFGTVAPPEETLRVAGGPLAMISVELATY